jgi:hypothetical protein
LIVFSSVCLADAGTQLRVFPPEISLRGQEARQTIAVQLVNDQGITRDVSATVKVKVANPKIAEVSGQTLKPKADGETKLLVELGQQKVEVSIVVKDAAVSRDVSFRLDVMPIFMKNGCNNGSCHGAARGKDGFHLSLFGYDPAGDYYKLTRQIIGRRVDLAVPEKSLVLEKSLGEVDHTGGQLFTQDSDDYRAMLRWIEAGAPNDGDNTPEPLGIELLPSKTVFAGKDQTQKTVVLARYSDGSVRDVTRLALFLTNNDAVASIDKDGVAKANNRGGAFVFARFNKFTVGSEVIVLPTDDNFVWKNVPEANFIDLLVFDKLKKLHLAPSELADDETFLRRVYLDLIGLPPTRDEYERFVADKSGDKRAKLIDQLLDREEFIDMWSMKWGELLRIRAVGNQPQYGRDAKAMWQYSAWVHDQMAANRPLNEFVADLVVGTGSNIKQPTSNLYTASERLTPQKTAEDFAQVFLGTRIQCAQCHNHPFDRWTMDDYYGFAAFFAGVNLKRGVEGREVVVFNNNANNTVDHLVDGRKMKPKFLGGDKPEIEGQDPRASLAKWLTSPDNAAFSQTMANIIWSHFFGRGIVEPVDDVRISNPPSNKELLEALGTKLAEYGFDKKKLVRDICNSRTYQLSAATNPTNELDEAYFSHSYVRRLRAEVLLDTITRITGTEDRFQSSPQGTRAVELYAGNVTNFFLTTFGRAPRETACSCEVNKEANLSQALHLVNGDTITLKVAGSRLIPSLLAAKAPPDKIVEELYILAFSRKPTAEETTKLVELINQELDDPTRVDKLAGLRAQLDQTYRRLEDQAKSLKAEYEKLKEDGQEAEALTNLEKQITQTEKQLAEARARQASNVPQMVYGDVLWGLFNSSEFAFNH